MHLHRAAVLAAAAFLSAGMAGEASTLPNLRPAAPIGLHVGQADGGQGQAIRFDTTTWNVSDNHLDLAGVPSGADEAIASQCMAWGPDHAGRACTAREEVGRFVFHPEHAHFHFDDYASYELRHVDEHDQPDLSDAGLIATGGKVSFCLMDTDRGGENSITDPGDLIGWYYACYVGYQGISAWWGDTYTAGLDGQQIVVPDDLEPGRYAVVIHVNPAGFLRESDLDDNRAHAAFTWTGSRLGEVRRYDTVDEGVRVRDALLGLPY